MKLGMKFVSLAGTVLAAGAIATSPIMASADADVDAAVFVGQTTSLTPVQLVGGTGTFAFSSIACVGVSSDDVPPANTCGISASGSYSNTVCGTGSASGTANTSEAGGGSDSVGFSITFVSGIGVVTGGADGVVVIIPTGGNPPANCVTQFTVPGVAVIP